MPKLTTCPVCGTPRVSIVLDGSRLRKARLEEGTGLCEMARRLGISAPYLVDIEFGRRAVRPASALAEKIRQAYPKGAA